MPDNSANFSYDGTNGPIGTTTVTRAELITALEQLNYAEGYNIRAIDELSGTGLVSVDSLGTAAVRSIAGSDGLTVSNATGISGNPTISVGTPLTLRQAIDDTESNAVTATKLVSVLSTGTSYAVPAPTPSVITRKHIINTTSSMITLTGAVWFNPGITTVRIEPYGSVDLVSGLGGFWNVIHPNPAESYGDIYLSSSAATTVSVQSTWYPDASTYTVGTHLKNFTIQGTNALKYTGKVPGVATITATASIATGTANKSVGFCVSHYDASAVTTTNEEEYKIIAFLDVTADVASLAVTGVVVMEEGDYIFSSFENTTNTDNITSSSGSIVATLLPILTT